MMPTFFRPLGPLRVADSAFLALAGAGLTAVAMIFLRRMSAHEHSITIAFYFMLTSAAVALITVFFGWNIPTWGEGLVLIFTGLAGGIGQLFLSFSYRFSEASALAVRSAARGGTGR